MSRKQNTLSLVTKQTIIKEIDEKNLKKSQIALKFGVAKSTISTILKNREKIEKANESNQFGPGRKRIRTGRNEDVEIALLRWIETAKSQNLDLTGPIIQKKAHFFADALGVTNFACSTGWLSRFKVRHNIMSKLNKQSCKQTYRKYEGPVGMYSKLNNQSSKQTCSEDDGTYDMYSLYSFLGEIWPPLASEYACCDIFVADKMGLFFKAHPWETYNYKGENCSRGKYSNERVTIMVACSMDGTGKIPLLVIARPVKPICFNGVRTFPAEYTSSDDAYMSKDIFTKWILKLDSKFEKEKRKVCLILDDSTSHVEVPGLKAIKCVYFPPNTSAKLQPFRQGIIKDLKIHYKKQMLLQSIECFDNQTEFSVSLLNAMCYLKSAWSSVSPATIRNSFRRCGFKHPCLPVTFEEEIKTVNDFVIQAAENRGLTSLSAFEEYVSMDDYILTSETLTGQDVKFEPPKLQDRLILNESDDTDTKPPSLIHFNEATMALRTVQTFLMQQEAASCALNNLDKVNTFVKECFVDNSS